MQMYIKLFASLPIKKGVFEVPIFHSKKQEQNKLFMPLQS